MKTLILIRHAKSSWANIGQSDFDRPLNERGQKDAPEMARRLVEKKVHVEQIVHSGSVRTTETMNLFRKVLELDKKFCISLQELYHASVFQLEETVSVLDDRYDTIALIGHNPGITEFANTLTDFKTDNMPTCSMIAVQSDAKDWSEFLEAKKVFLFYDYPKRDLK